MYNLVIERFGEKLALSHWLLYGRRGFVRCLLNLDERFSATFYEVPVP